MRRLLVLEGWLAARSTILRVWTGPDLVKIVSTNSFIYWSVGPRAEGWVAEDAEMIRLTRAGLLRVDSLIAEYVPAEFRTSHVV